MVDAASILVSRRRRQAKTDKTDGETLVRTLLAYKRGEPRVCSMVRAPTPEEEDRRRICRERKTLTGERVEHVNRIKGLLFAQGVGDYEPLRRNCRTQLEELKTGDGRPLPAHLKKQIARELDRLEIILAQLRVVEAERDALLEPTAEQASTPATMIAQLRGIGPEFAGVLWSEGLFRHFTPEGSWRPTRAWRQRLGRADRSGTSRECPSPAILGCGRPWYRWPGFG